MFTALPLSPRIIQQYSPARVLTVGLLVSVVGSGLAAAAPTVLVFAAGRFIAGFAGAVLAVYGVSAAIRYLEDSLRLKVIAAMSAMWILPAVVGPSIAIAIEHTTSWRIAVLVPLPVMVIGRFLVMRAAPEQQAGDEQRRPIARTLLVPAGIAGFVALNASPWPAVSPVAILVALIGFLALMPAGTARLRRGAPAALAGLTLFAAGYFGASALVTLLLTHTFGATLVQAGVVLSAAQIGWGVAALLAPKLGARGLPPVWGLALAASGVLAIAILGLTGGPWGGALVAWTCSGVGIGLSYPALYLRATTETPF
jgi:MFS family permease